MGEFDYIDSYKIHKCEYKNTLCILPSNRYNSTYLTASTSQFKTNLVVSESPHILRKKDIPKDAYILYSIEKERPISHNGLWVFSRDITKAIQLKNIAGFHKNSLLYFLDLETILLVTEGISFGPQGHYDQLPIVFSSKYVADQFFNIFILSPYFSPGLSFSKKLSDYNFTMGRLSNNTNELHTCFPVKYSLSNMELELLSNPGHELHNIEKAIETSLFTILPQLVKDQTLNLSNKEIMQYSIQLSNVELSR